MVDYWFVGGLESDASNSIEFSCRQRMGKSKVFLSITFRIGLVALIMAGLSMWMMWVTCYLHQMYPLIEPKMEM